MALFPAPILTNGATHSAQQFRMLVRDLANGAEGITQGDDLKVIQRATPGGGILVGDGSAVVRGRANTFQGSLRGLQHRRRGRADRRDRRQRTLRHGHPPDRRPRIRGHPEPGTDQIAYFQVISNVSSAATAIPDSRTGIPLARIDIPASTSTITNAMVTDLRKVANPRRSRSLLTQSPASISTGIGSSTSYSYFSTAAGWNITIPDWASKVIVKLDVSPLRYDLGNFFGQISATFGASLSVQATLLDDNQGTGPRRIPAIMADTLTIPTAYRSTTQLLRVRASGLTAGQAARIYVDSGTTLVADVQFEEAPR
jgi:hypothetical protein